MCVCVCVRMCTNHSGLLHGAPYPMGGVLASCPFPLRVAGAELYGRCVVVGVETNDTDSECLY